MSSVLKPTGECAGKLMCHWRGLAQNGETCPTWRVSLTGNCSCSDKLHSSARPTTTHDRPPPPLPLERGPKPLHIQGPQQAKYQTRQPKPPQLHLPLPLFIQWAGLPLGRCDLSVLLRFLGLGLDEGLEYALLLFEVLYLILEFCVFNLLLLGILLGQCL